MLPANTACAAIRKTRSIAIWRLTPRSPGNVRELENAIEYAVAVGRGQTIQPEDLPLEVTGDAPIPDLAPPRRADGGEREYLRSVLDQHQWRRDEAAKALGVSRTTLWRRMREMQLG